MSSNTLLAYVVALLVSPTVTLRAQGADVEVQLHDGRAISGELYAVQDTAILVFSDEGAVSQEFESEIPGRYSIDTRTIKRVIVRAKSGVLKSMGIGALVGGGVGAVVGLAGGDDPAGGWFRMSAGEKALAGAVVLGAGGMVVGLVVGIVQSEKERVVEPLPDGDLSTLNAVARYPAGKSVDPKETR
jgi:hypothetical protein